MIRFNGPPNVGKEIDYIKMEIARVHSLSVIEDAAKGLMSSY